MALIKDIYDSNLSQLKIDATLCKDIIKYEHSFVRKNQEHVDFFGSALLGTHRVIWGNEERNKWLDDILEVDEIALRKDIYDLPADLNPKTPDGKMKIKVGLNFINLSFVYLAHRINVSKLPRQLRTDAMESIFRVIHYKFITSLIQNYFKTHMSERRTAEAAFNELNDRFDLKRYGSWKKLIDMRAEMLSSTRTIHKATLENFNDDKSIIYVVTDIQTRIRRLIQVYFGVLDDVTRSKRHLVTTSSMVDTDDGQMVKDIVIEKNNYYRYLMQVLPDKRSLIKDDILYPLLDINHSASPDKVREILGYISDHARDKEVTVLCNELLIFVFSFMKEKKLKTSQLADLATRLKAMFTGSKIKDPAILNLRDKGDALVRKGSKYSRTAPVSTERTVVLLYLTIRTLSINRYKA